MPKLNKKEKSNIDQLLDNIKDINSLQIALEKIEINKDNLQSTPHSGSHNLYQVYVLTALNKAMHFYSELPETGMAQIRDIMKRYDFLFTGQDPNPDEDKYYSNLRYSFEALRFFNMTADIAEGIQKDQIEFSAMKEMFITARNLMNNLRYVNDILSQNLFLDSIVRIPLFARDACTKMAKNKQIDGSIAEVVKVLLAINKNMPALNELARKNWQHITKYDPESTIAQVIKAYDNMQLGKEYDPIRVLVRVLFTLHHDINPLPDLHAKSFRRYLEIAVEKMQANGVQHYQADNAYQFLLAIYYKEKLIETLQRDGIVSKQQLNTVLEQYVQKGGKKSSDTLPLFILEYILTGDKGAIKDMDRMLHQVNDEVRKTVLASFLLDSLLRRNEFQRVVSFLEHKLFSALKSNDELFVLYLYAKVCLNGDVLEKMHNTQGLLANTNLDPKITPEEIERIASIDDNTVIKPYYLVHTLIWLKEQHASITPLENMVAKINRFTLPENQEDLGYIDFFRDIFIYGPEDTKNKEAIECVEKAYQRLLELCVEGDREARKEVGDRLLKLYLLCDMHDKAFAFMQKLALVDARYKDYLSHLEQNPELSKEDQIEALAEFSKVVVRDDISSIIAPIIQRQYYELVRQAIALSLQNSEVREEAAVEVVEPIVKLGDVEIKLADCRNFTDDNGVEHYVYCEPKVWRDIPDKILTEQFETQLIIDLGFTRAKGANGIKHLKGDVHEVKINDNPRILGFGAKVKIEAEGNNEINGSEIHLLYFSKYIHNAHQKNTFKEETNRMQAQADSLKGRGVA